MENELRAKEEHIAKDNERRAEKRLAQQKLAEEAAAKERALEAEKKAAGVEGAAESEVDEPEIDLSELEGKEGDEQVARVWKSPELLEKAQAERSENEKRKEAKKLAASESREKSSRLGPRYKKRRRGSARATRKRKFL